MHRIVSTAKYIMDRINGATFRNLTAVEVKAVLDDAKVNNKQILLLDVRSDAEFRESHIVGANNIPVDDLSQRIGELESSKNKYIIVYCAAGARSKKACRILARAGYRKIMNIEKGG